MAGEKPSLKERLDPRQITGTAPLMPLVVLFGLNAVDELDRTAFGVLTPEIKDHFGLNLAGLALLTAAILPVGILIELPIAYLADRYNRTRMAALFLFEPGSDRIVCERVYFDRGAIDAQVQSRQTG